MARKRKTKKVTVAELQSYIEGAIEFNDEGWCPDKPQWDKLVDMIMNIKEEEPKVVYKQPPSQPAGRNSGPVAMEPGPIDDVLENASTGEDGYDSMESQAPKIDMRKMKPQRVSAESVDPETGAVQSGIQVKTPDIGGEYNTPFA